MRTRVATLALLGVLALAASADAAQNKRLHALATRYDAHLREARPDLGSRAGIGGCSDRLVPLTQSSLTADAALLAALLDSTAVLQREWLTRRDRRALVALHDRIEREAAPLRAGVWRREPSAYLPLAHDAIMEVARQPHVSPCERERRSLCRLRAVPEVLRAAEVNLAAGAVFDPDSEVTRWNAALGELRTTLPGLFAECHDAERFADLVEADSLALGAGRHFVARLRAPALGASAP